MFKYLVLSSVCILTLTACPSGSGDSPAPIKDEAGGANEILAQEKIEASCKYSFEEGDQAVSVLPTEKLKTGLFEKKYNESLLNAVLSTSGAETRRFAEMTGVKLYKILSLKAETDCLFNQSLKDAPSPLSKYFRDNDKESNVEGLYMGFDEVQKKMNTPQAEAAVILKTTTPRYSMVHEFMHHLFNIQSSKTGDQIRSEAIQSLNELDKIEKAFKDDKSAERLKEYANKTQVAIEDTIAVLVGFTLEEVAIETELHQKYSQALLKYVHDYSRLNGDFYIYSSAQSANEMLEKLGTGVDNINTAKLKLLIDKEISALEERAIDDQMRSLSSKISNLKRTADFHAQAARSRLKEKLRLRGLEFKYGIVPTDMHPSAGCSHSQEADSVFEKLNEVL